MSVAAVYKNVKFLRFCIDKVAGNYLNYSTSTTSSATSSCYLFLTNSLQIRNSQKLVRQASATNYICSQRRLYCSTDTPEEEDIAKKDDSAGKIDKAYRPVDLETSMLYMDSDAYEETYGDKPVWYHYRPNHKGGRSKLTTRKTCVRGGVHTTGNPCPICRDEHLVLDYKNVKLLKQFLSPNELTVYTPDRVQVCMKQYNKLLVSLEKAKEVGLLEDHTLKFRTYDYAQYYPSLSHTKILAPVDHSVTDSFAYKVLKEESNV